MRDWQRLSAPPLAVVHTVIDEPLRPHLELWIDAVLGNATWWRGMCGRWRPTS
jgi:hypothetical protein